MKKCFFQLACCLVLIAIACDKNSIDPRSPNPVILPIEHPCLTQVFSKRLSKTITTRFDTSAFGVPSVAMQNEAYSFDQFGRLDSIFNDKWGCQKIVYGPDGQVETVFSNTAHGQPMLDFVHYFYENGQLSRIDRRRFFWGTDGFLAKTRFDDDNDETIYTNDGCGNAEAYRDFYDTGGPEHRLSVAEYATTINPYFLIGMHRIAPTQHSVFNRTFSYLVHWDCADYISEPTYFSYEYDADELPVKMTGPGRTVEFFYETF